MVAILGTIQGLSTFQFPSLDILTRTSAYAWAQVGSGFLILILLCTVIGFTLQVYAQQKIPAHIASMLFLMESPFAAFFGFMILNEPLSPRSIAGATLVMASIALIPYFNRIVFFFRKSVA